MRDDNRWVRRLAGAIAVAAVLCVGSTALPAETVYDCNAPENRATPTTVEIVLAKKWKGQVDEIKQAMTGDDPAVKVRIKVFPFLDPPMNLGIGKCVRAEQARLAIREAMKYSGGVDRLIRQDILPHHWIKIGSTDLAELSWIPVTPEELARLTDSSLSTAQFQELYRQLATPKERKLPFGMGSEKLSQQEPSAIEVISHQWRPDAVWERIGKTKFIWSATVRNNSEKRQRVFVYYDLLDDRGVPLARNVANGYIDPHQTAEIASDSYILSVDLPYVRSSRATAKGGFPN
jgi:hypothetical protein